MSNRVNVGVGSKVILHFEKPVARFVALAGVQPKCELNYNFTGTIVDIKDTALLTPEGKKEYEFTVRNSYGSELTTKRSNILECIVIDE